MNTTTTPRTHICTYFSWHVTTLSRHLHPPHSAPIKLLLEDKEIIHIYNDKDSNIEKMHSAEGILIQAKLQHLSYHLMEIRIEEFLLSHSLFETVLEKRSLNPF